MVYPVAGYKVKLDHKSTASTGSDLYKFSPLSVELLPRSCPQFGGSLGDGFARQLSAGNNMAEENCLQSFLVFKEFVEGINWNLYKKIVIWLMFCFSNYLLSIFIILYAN